jgi:hypothetical protein
LTSPENYAKIANRLKKLPSDGKHNFVAIAEELGESVYTVRGVWSGEIVKPKPRPVSKRPRRIANDHKSTVVFGQVLEKVGTRFTQPVKCKTCNRKFNLLLKGGNCLECEHEVVEQTMRNCYG